MPVPVPTRCPSHPISKPLSLDSRSSSLVKQSALKHLLNSLPDPPTGPPPAFTDRETWIKSLPPSRRYKVRQETASPNRRVISHFALSVVAATATDSRDATLSKIRRSSLISTASPSSFAMVQDSPINSAGTANVYATKVAHAPLSNGKPWPPSPPTAIKQAIRADERKKSMISDSVVACDSGRDADDELSEEWTEDEAFFAGPTMHRQTSMKRRSSLEENNRNAETLVEQMSASGVFNPVIELDSDVDIPLAPFDGTLATSVTSNSEHASCDTSVQTFEIAQTKQVPLQRNELSVQRKVLSPIPTTISPADMNVYSKRIAEPMSEWVAEYIWKVVTHGMSLPPNFVTAESGYGALTRAYSVQPPVYLADSIRTLLCATLLQPSAVFLALWYIARLPVFFGVFDHDRKIESKEYKFRLELLGEGSQEPGAEKNRQLLEAHAPFRLFLLGVMLANKWLDDNTFSNKTWHQVSGVPIRALNRLESLGLDLLSHDLSMLPQAWAQWLDHVQNYHRSLAPYPEPIGPPKDTPHVMIRRTIEDLIVAGSPPLATGVLPEPVFLGLEERKKERERERLAKEQLDLFDVDLDEDGPLRAEYFPKRHGASSRIETDRKSSEYSARGLPPPAEWSPAADPPIHRTRPVYQAVQRPPPAPILAHAHAHLPNAAPQTAQAMSYYGKADASFQDTRTQCQTHVLAHGRNESNAWNTSNDHRSNIFAFAQLRPPGYVAPYSAQYPSVLVPSIPYSLPALWTRPPPAVAQHYLQSECQPMGTFDAPPASELFRPTWLRT